MILLLIKYKYVYCFYLLHEEPCNVDVANKSLLLLLLLLLKTETASAVLSTKRRTPVMKERLNKSANCFKISFFRRNNIL